MEVAILFFGLLFIFFVIGSVLGWIAFSRSDKLSKEHALLYREVRELEDKLNHYTSSVAEQDSQKALGNSDEDAYSNRVDENGKYGGDKGERDRDEIASSTNFAQGEKPPEFSADKPKASDPASSETSHHNHWSTPSDPNPLVENIKANWMIWIGGISIGLAGVFLVKYSIDNGLLGPTARILLAVVSGLLLHIAAYYLHHKKGQNDIFAAMAGGASLILYSACLAALHLYQLFSPGGAFILLAIVSLATMLLALVQGPVLAALGILGAYLVPIFVSTGSGNITAALLYSFIVSCSALLLIRFVSRDWLWIGTVVGAGFWWLISVSTEAAEISRLLYLLALAYVVMAIETWDWRIKRALIAKDMFADKGLLALIKDSFASDQKKVMIMLAAVLLAWMISLSLAPLVSTLVWVLVAFVLLTLWLAAQQTLLLPLAWLGFGAVIVGLLLQGMNIDSLDLRRLSTTSDKLLLLLLVALALVYAACSFVASRISEYKGYWSSLALLAPLILIALAYLRVSAVQADWHWALLAAGLGAVYFHLLYRKKTQLSPTVMAAIIFAGHVAYSLAIVILFQSATLTLALAAQVVSLAWLDRYFRLPILPILIKIILAVIIARLTFNPWLLNYPADIHWSLWTYGGSFLCCVLAAYFIRDRDSLLSWVKAAAAHLLVLTIIAETRYQLYDGDIFAHQYSFLEAAINTSVWGILGLVYRLRMQVAQQLAIIYHWVSTILLAAALINYVLFLLFAHNPLFTTSSVSSTPIANILLLAYGLPCALAFALLYFQKDNTMRRIIGCIAAFMLLVFVSLEIRHLWHGGLDISQPTFAGEVYTYSMVWLLMAIGGSLIAAKLQSRDLYRGSMVFLLVVIAKIFLIDTSDLSSLWRVAAFMGLGLALLGLAYMHQKMQPIAVANESDKVG